MKILLLYEFQHRALGQLVHAPVADVTLLPGVLSEEDVEDDSHERHEGEHENPSHRLRRLSVVEQDADYRRNHDCDIEQQIKPMEINHILILIKY